MSSVCLFLKFAPMYRVTSKNSISIGEHFPVNFMVGWSVLQFCKNVSNSVCVPDHVIKISSMYLSHSLILSAFSCISLCSNSPMNIPLYEGAMMFPMGTPLICR